MNDEFRAMQLSRDEAIWEINRLRSLLDEAETALRIAYEKTKGLSWKGGASGPTWITEPRRVLAKLAEAKRMPNALRARRRNETQNGR